MLTPFGSIYFVSLLACQNSFSVSILYIDSGSGFAIHRLPWQYMASSCEYKNCFVGKLLSTEYTSLKILETLLF